MTTKCEDCQRRRRLLRYITVEQYETVLAGPRWRVNIAHQGLKKPRQSINGFESHAQASGVRYAIVEMALRGTR